MAQHRYAGSGDSQPTAAQPTAAQLAARGRRRRLIRALILLVTVGGIVAAGFWGVATLRRSFSSPECVFTSATTESLDPEQAGNAALISAIATKRGLPPRATTIALATALQESKLRNIRFGDRDSLGLFQQRPSQGWGTDAQILDPAYATNKFLDALVKIDRWQTRDITTVAQAVQRSAYPEAYRQHEQKARSIASALTGQSQQATTCKLDVPKEISSAAALGVDLTNQLGVTATTDGNTVRFTAGAEALQWQLAHWAVARADIYGVTSVSVGTATWTRSDGDDALQWRTGSTANPGVTITLGPAQG